MQLVSVIIPTYNRPKYLERAIISIKKQTYRNIELIIVDDNGKGTKNQKLSEGIVKKYEKELNIIYIPHNKNMNGSIARNTGIKKSNGEYICFLDDDDEFNESKIEKQIKFLTSNNIEWGACYTGHNRVYSSGIIKKYNPIECGVLNYQILTRTIDMCSGSTLMIRKGVIEQVGMFDENFTRFQDIEYVLRISQKYKIGVISEALVNIYTHSGSNKEIAIDELIKNREYFLEKFKRDIEKLSVNERNKFYYFFYIDIIKECLKRRDLKAAYKYFQKIDDKSQALRKILNDILVAVSNKLK